MRGVKYTEASLEKQQENGKDAKWEIFTGNRIMASFHYGVSQSCIWLKLQGPHSAFRVHWAIAKAGDGCHMLPAALTVIAFPISYWETIASHRGRQTCTAFAFLAQTTHYFYITARNNNRTCQQAEWSPKAASGSRDCQIIVTTHQEKKGRCLLAALWQCC